MAAPDTTPRNSWNVYSTGERNQSMHPQDRLRSRYIRTDDPLPVMNYKQLEKALPSNYNLHLNRSPMETEESQPGLFEGEILPVEEKFVEGVEQTSEFLEEEIPPVEESENYVSLIPTKGFGPVGDDISVEANRGLSEITEVWVNGIQAGFIVVSDTSLIFTIPEGATSGPVELINSHGNLINAGTLEIISG